MLYISRLVPGMRVGSPTASPLLPGLDISRVNGSLVFIRKYMKSYLARSGTSFLHIHMPLTVRIVTIQLGYFNDSLSDQVTLMTVMRVLANAYEQTLFSLVCRTTASFLSRLNLSCS